MIAEKIRWRENDPEAYEQARLAAVWHSRKPDRYPDGVLLAESEQDVIDAVRLAGERDMKVKARSGGHSWTASSVRDGGLLINLDGVDELSIDPENRTAEVRPGSRGRDLNRLLAEEGLFFPSGHCPTIAVGGFLLQGGWGWLSRKYGPACTNVIGVDVVTADGTVVHADESENSDLLWAARGGGSGFFGVVTKYYLKVHPYPTDIKRSVYVYSRDDMEEVLDWAVRMHDEWPLELELQIFGTPNQMAPEDEDDRTLTILAFANCYSEADATSALELLETCPARERALVAETFVDATLDDLYAIIDEVARPETAFAGDSLWTDAGAEEIVPVFMEMTDQLPTPESYVLIWPWPDHSLEGCALSITGRHYMSPFAGWTDPSDEAKLAPWPGDQVRRVDHLSKGIQLADENLIGRPDSRYMTDENTARLEELRDKWDPDRRFHSFLFGGGAEKSG
jgi:FAD/FMN-containing dehydrogenase